MIRPMQEKDLDAVAAIEAACIQQPWSRKSFAESLEKEYSLFLVAEEEEEVSGYIGLYLTYEDAEITGIAVLPEKRRRKRKRAFGAGNRARRKEGRAENLTGGQKVK